MSDTSCWLGPVPFTPLGAPSVLGLTLSFLKASHPPRLVQRAWAGVTSVLASP